MTNAHAKYEVFLKGIKVAYLWVGYFILMEDMIRASTFWSVSVTRSTGELFCMMEMSFCNASRIIYLCQS